MRLIINTSSTYKGGSVQVARSFIEECRKFPENTYHIVLGNKLGELIDDSQYPENFAFYRIGYRPAQKVFSIKSGTYFFEELEKRVQPDVIFTTSGPAYWHPESPHLVGYNLPHYIYFDSPFFSTLSVFRRWRWKLKGFFITYFYKRDADAYVVQTDDVNRRLRLLLNSEKVYTVSNTISSHYLTRKDVPHKLSAKGPKEFRFLSLSAWYPHKNLDVLLPVLDCLSEQLRERVRFVLTLPEDDFNREFSDKAAKNIVNVGPVKPEEGPSLYRECDALFLPTLLECFSASYAEAMAMEKPILTSDLDFAKTVCSDSAIYVDPMNPHEIATAIEEMVTNENLRNDLINKGRTQLKTFATAEQRAEQYLTICKKLIDERKNQG